MGVHDFLPACLYVCMPDSVCSCIYYVLMCVRECPECMDVIVCAFVFMYGWCPAGLPACMCSCVDVCVCVFPVFLNCGMRV